MTLYHTLPAQVEAVRWLDNNLEEVQALAGTRSVDVGVEAQAFNPIGTYIQVDTTSQPGPYPTGELWVEGSQSILPVMSGDWVVKEAVGCRIVKHVDFLNTFDISTATTEVQTELESFPTIGPECFANEDETVISWKGRNFYRGCDVFVSDSPDGGQTHCVKRVQHPGFIHEDWVGNTRTEAGTQIGGIDQL